MNIKMLWYPANPTRLEKIEIIGKYIDTLLIQCAWTQLPDSGLSFAKQMEWRDYRDDLKSVTDDFFDNPDDVKLPTPPTEE